MNKDQQDEHSGKNNQQQLNKNQTLQDAGAAVPDYGRSLQKAVEESKQNPQQETQSRPFNNDETIGNP